jgi:hypothetical protein
VGAGLAVPLVGLAALLGGSASAGAALGGAALAAVAQGVAVALLRPAMGAPTAAFVRRWVGGMAVRGAATVLLAVVLVLVRDRSPVLWMAAGYFGVLLPLLFVETRFLR